MAISRTDFVKYYPWLYHMAEAGSWESIRAHGLRSTSALLDLFEVAPADRHAIESQRRAESVQIHHPDYGAAVIRDQKPMTDAALDGCLTDMSPRQWYEHLNRKVFFWPTRKRLERLLNARAYRDRSHTVLTLDTAHLVEAYAQSTYLSPINSGSTLFLPRPRGNDTLVPLGNYEFESRRRVRGVSGAIAEVAVDYMISDVLSIVTRVEMRQGNLITGVLFER